MATFRIATATKTATPRQERRERNERPLGATLGTLLAAKGQELVLPAEERPERQVPAPGGNPFESQGLRPWYENEDCPRPGATLPVLTAEDLREMVRRSRPLTAEEVELMNRRPEVLPEIPLPKRERKGETTPEEAKRLAEVERWAWEQARNGQAAARKIRNEAPGKAKCRGNFEARRWRNLLFDLAQRVREETTAPVFVDIDGDRVVITRGRDRATWNRKTQKGRNCRPGQNGAILALLGREEFEVVIR